MNDESRLPILTGRAQRGAMSFADIASIIGAGIVLGRIGYLLYVKVLKP